MTFLKILITLFALLFLGYGILLLFSNKWLPKLETLILSKPPERSAVTRIGIWKFRAHGIFFIIVSILLLLGVVIPGMDLSMLFFVAVIALIASFVLGIVWAHQTKKEKAGSNKLK